MELKEHPLLYPEALLGTKHDKLSSWDVVYSLNMATACSTIGSSHTYLQVCRQASDFLKGMWAVVNVVLVFRYTRVRTISSRIARLIATCVSFSLCLPYLLIFPFTPVGLAALLGICTLIMGVLGRRDDIVTTGITTAVVMVVAAMSAQTAWQQPLLRLVDTVVGIALGVACKWIGSYLVYLGERPYDRSS